MSGPVSQTDGFLWSREAWLRLRIVSDQRRFARRAQQRDLFVEGGTIGRSADNDWVLRIPRATSLRTHARVQSAKALLSAGRQHHGVYVNDRHGAASQARLDGYRLSDGEYCAWATTHRRSPRGAAGAAGRSRRSKTRRRRPDSIHALPPRALRPDGDMAHRSICMSCCSRATVRTRCCRSMPTGQSVDSGRCAALARTRMPSSCPVAAADGPDRSRSGGAWRASPRRSTRAEGRC